MSHPVVTQIKTELKHHVDPQYRDGAINFFKEPIKCWGVRSPEVKRITSKGYAQVKSLSKTEIFKLAEELLKSNKNEEAWIAYDWIGRRKTEFELSDFKFFEKIIKQYNTNWAMVDTFCTHAFGELLAKFPELIPQVKGYVKSKNRWVRRAAAVSFIGPLQKAGDYRKDIFWVADQLLEDTDDLVQKGYGWMLKVAADKYEKDVFNYVMKNKDKMPRTALRYAIEKMPSGKKKQAMS